MSNITQEKKVVDGNKEEYYRLLLQEVKRLARIPSVRELDTYKQLSRFFLFKHHDWREEFNKFLNQDIRRVLKPAYKKVFKDFTEIEFWFALLSDPNYNNNNRSVLLEDWFKWKIENGTAYTSERAKEGLARLFSTYEREVQTEVIETINRDAYLLKLFKGNEALYDKFFEQCKGKKGVGILIELSAVIIALECEDNYYGYLLTTSGNLATLHTELSKHFHLAKYPTFAKSLTSYKELPKGRKEKINVAKKEYQKILS